MLGAEMRAARITRRTAVRPPRYAPLFGAGPYDPANERPDDVPFEEQVLALQEVVDAAKIATFYYLGRVDGRDRTLDLADRFSQPDMQMSQEDLQRMAQVCGAELGARSQELMDMSKRLEAAGR